MTVFPKNLTVLWRWTAERDRWPLWLPVLLGAGAALYFALPAEPPNLAAWFAAGFSAFAITAAVLLRPARVVLALAAALALGFAMAKFRADAVAAPVLARAASSISMPASPRWKRRMPERG